MAIRDAVRAGQFYPTGRNELLAVVNKYLQKSREEDLKDEWGVMLPHAGYVYCADVIGKTLSGIRLPSRLIILCPNHTGYGQPLGVWPDGFWRTPLGDVKVDSALAAEIIGENCGFTADLHSHLAEHAIEVLLPFLQVMDANLTIVPICVGIRNPAFLERAAKGLADVLKRPENADTGVIVSSDMNHYESHKTTLAKDEEALKFALAADPAGLLRVTEAASISMCGAAPLALALYAAGDLGGTSLTLMGHTTSAAASGDYSHTVGYAGLRLSRPAAAN